MKITGIFILACWILTPLLYAEQPIFKLGMFTIEVKESTGGFAILRQGEEIIKTSDVPFFKSLSFMENVTIAFGIFHFKKSFEREASLDKFLGYTWDGQKLELSYTASNRPWVRGKLLFMLHSSEILSCEMDVKNFQGSRGMKLAFECNSLKNHFLGFGEQYNKTDQAGEKFGIWVSEQGFGRAEKPKLPWVGDLHATYFPMPYFLDPAGYGFLLCSPEYSFFDLVATKTDQWSFEVWEREKATFLVFGGPEPLDVVSQLTAITGRSRIPPDWAFSAWLAVQGGRSEVERVADLVLEKGMPVSTIWSQDWVGTRLNLPFLYELKYHWIADEELYPDLPGMINDLHDRGLKFLGYFNSFVVPRYEHFLEGMENGYLIENCTGMPYVVLFADFFTSMVDLTNPGAVDWVQEYLACALEMGMDGWMCDFGEWLPYDASLYDSTPSSRFHNLYATRWHQINMEVLEQFHPDGDFAVFTRSGYTGESGVCQIVWAGDQSADWSEEDGLPTVIPAGLNLGLSGIGFFTHDIAGFSGGPSTKELFFRWTELGAFSPIMRTHDGIMKDLNWNFEKDEETLKHFDFYTRVHEYLKEYLLNLAAEYNETGHPLIRHHVLVFPDDPRSVTINDQYFLGNDYLVAPIIKKGATSRMIYLPEGTWYYVWNNKKFHGPADIEVDAPLEIIPVFSRAPVNLSAEILE